MHSFHAYLLTGEMVAWAIRVKTTCLPMDPCPDCFFDVSPLSTPVLISLSSSMPSCSLHIWMVNASTMMKPHAKQTCPKQRKMK